MIFSRDMTELEAVGVRVTDVGFNEATSEKYKKDIQEQLSYGQLIIY